MKNIHLFNFLHGVRRWDIFCSFYFWKNARDIFSPTCLPVFLECLRYFLCYSSSYFWENNWDVFSAMGFLGDNQTYFLQERNERHIIHLFYCKKPCMFLNDNCSIIRFKQAVDYFVQYHLLAYVQLPTNFYPISCFSRRRCHPFPFPPPQVASDAAMSDHITIGYFPSNFYANNLIFYRPFLSWYELCAIAYCP
jgi:hypothetical protein